MALIFSLNGDYKVQYEIRIGSELILYDHDFISIEIDNGFDWRKHSITCTDCKEFISTLGKDSLKWFLKSDEGLFILKLDEFGLQNDHFSNQFSLINSDNFYGTKAKFIKIKADLKTLDEIRVNLESIEKYESCAELRDAIKYIKSQ